MMTEVIIRLLDLPYETKGFTAVDSNGDYNLYLNARYNHETQQTAYDHELRHIDGEHFYLDSDVTQDELEADRVGDGLQDIPPVGDDAHIVPTPEPPQPEYPVYSPQPVAKIATTTQTTKPDFADLRKKSGLTTFQVAKLAGIRQSSYVNYELGIRPCPPAHETAILRILDKYR